ncbi:hypothetical protein CIPAW_09G023800 [Carya illinoinensis]|uniref:Uncharacterized protein n=1 Tax=Carya illinoinensis TaxID=32201 RepID=A0A8T1PHZ5_CARIL|nr:hypothetical protein CIPAW_09G023800 [Carya illinoinensis]
MSVIHFPLFKSNPLYFTALHFSLSLSLSLSLSHFGSFSLSLSLSSLFQWLFGSCTGWCSCPSLAPASRSSTSYSTQSSTSPPEPTPLGRGVGGRLQTCWKLNFPGKLLGKSEWFSTNVCWSGPTGCHGIFVFF